MSDEYEDDLETPEAEGSPETAAGGPTLQDLKKLRSENKSLRTRLREVEERELATRFGERVVGLIPEEVTDYERRVALAEKYQAELKASDGPQTEQATEDAPREEPSPEERALATVVQGGPNPTSPSGLGPMTYKEFEDLRRLNPVEAAEQARRRGMVESDWGVLAP